MPVGHVVDGRYVVYEDCECNLGDTDMCYSGFQNEYHLHTHLPDTQQKLRYHLAGQLLCTDNDEVMQVNSIIQRFLGNGSIPKFEGDELTRPLTKIADKIGFEFTNHTLEVLDKHSEVSW